MRLSLADQTRFADVILNPAEPTDALVRAFRARMGKLSVKVDEALDWDEWEKEIIKDIQTGVLDELINAAKKDYENGNTEEV